jgi:glycosyltransferase involved in cell wall biosynthesis
MEPLGQSQVLPYLKGLSKEYSITLITFEKVNDYADKHMLARLEEQCELYGINWIIKKYPNTPRFYTVFTNFLIMFYVTFREVSKNKIRIIHSRSYLPTLVGYLVSIFFRIEIIFDMRALWPEELILAGRIKRKSVSHRVLIWVERICLAKSSAIVSLTNAGVVYLRSKYKKELKDKIVTVIPTCVDLDKFMFSPRPNLSPTIHGCVGTLLSGWFLTDWLSKWFLIVLEKNREAQFEIISRDDEVEICKSLPFCSEAKGSLKIRSALSSEMPKIFSRHSVAVMFFSAGIGKLGSAPTRLAEALASGIPVVANSGVGDLEDIITKNRVGVILNSHSRQDLLNAYSELNILLKDEKLSLRCRQTAESIFSLDVAISKYSEIYNSLSQLENKCVE